MKSTDLSKILKNFTSGWVAITSDYTQVLAYGKTLKEVTKKVEKLNRTDVVLFSASKNYRGYATIA